MNEYITAKALVNAHQQAFINVGADALLSGLVAPKGGDAPEFMKREELVGSVLAKMQAWHRVEAEGRDPVLKCVLLFVCLIVDNLVRWIS